MISRKASPRLILERVGLYSMLILTSLAIVYPLFLIASSSFKPEIEIFAFPMTLFPQDGTTANFADLQRNFPTYIWNSVKVTFTIVVVQLLTATTGGYAFSKLEWRGREILFLTYIATFMIPIHAIIIPQFIIVRNMGLFDSHMALILTSAFTAFGTFLVKQFFVTVPDSLLEAARIDGASEYTIFARLMLPLSKPVLATLIIFSFRFFWNDFFGPLIYIVSPSRKTLTLGMADFVTQYAIRYGPQMAASLISIVPVMIVFIAAQKYFVGGIVTTGIKG